MLSTIVQRGQQSQQDKTTLPRSGCAAAPSLGSTHSTSDPSPWLMLPG